MKKSKQIVVYGSYGYTGQLIIKECRNKGLDVVLAGRDADKLKLQSELSGYPYQKTDINDYKGLIHLLQHAALVIHCGGPFQFTAHLMAAACLATQTHYTDITGECDVFESLSLLDLQAKEAGITILPGTGFDVVPSDCLALHLKHKLPSATHLQLAFTMSKGGLSRGTSKTMAEGLGNGGMIRKEGKLTSITLGEKIMEVDFGPFTAKALCIPWGDISTAWRSTGIPNIEVYNGTTDKIIRAVKVSNYLNWLLRLRWVKNSIKKQMDKTTGPSEERRAAGKSFLWGKVWDANGTTSTSRIETIDGYSLTAKASVLIAEKIVSGNFKNGYQTPAMAYGADLILEIANTKRVDA